MANEDQIYALQLRVARLERALDYLAQTLNVPLPDERWGRDPLAEGIQALLLKGQKLEAIKFYRAQTGASLADAQRAVEAIAQG